LPGQSELHPDVLLRSDIYVEYAPHSRIEGEIQQLPHDHPVTELWEVTAGRASGRRDAHQITLFDSVGFAVEDFSALRYVGTKLAEWPYYADLDLLADPNDPRDLFGMLLCAGTSSVQPLS
jgi:ornithine cyclodeaminase